MLYVGNGFTVGSKQNLVKSIINRIYSGDSKAFKKDYVKIYLFAKEQDIAYNIKNEER